MKKELMLLIAFLAIFSLSCTKQPEQIACTMDAKVCPDGTAFGRDPNNNCEFPVCPDEKPIPVEPDGGIGLTNPYVRYVSTDKAECTTLLFQCIPGSSPFFDDTGCGCKADEPKKYVSNDLDECSRIRYMCEESRIPFSDEDGCGCEFTFEEEKPSEGKLAAIDCTEEQRNKLCTKEYIPVCGWFNQDIQCVKYPCAADYGNKCTACTDEKVGYYTEGKCPTDSDTVLK
ncbi:MAG: hypothetical protein HGA85_04705 [Nanoarchaeota archaeon]|nr:hypothetical protein [Nanoarchaeota archaeon]